MLLPIERKAGDVRLRARVLYRLLGRGLLRRLAALRFRSALPRGLRYAIFAGALFWVVDFATCL